MEKRTLGKTTLEVTRLGFGGARIGLEYVAPAQAETLLNAVLDAGITFIDTAACYDNSEELIGRYLSGRRDAFVLATKCGHVTAEARGEAWTQAVIEESVDRSLRRLGTDHVDLLQLHSCSAEVLKQGEAVEAVMRAKAAGKTRYVGYSGDGENALAAVRMGVFDTLQTSFNLVDQHALERVLPEAKAAGMGVIAKRPVANGALGKDAPAYKYAEEYWKRTQSLRIPEGAPEDPMELSLRFTLSHEAVDSAIVGTTKAEHARKNVELAGAGPLPEAVVEALHAQFRDLGGEWKPQT